MLIGAMRLKIPLLIGPVGTAGGDVHLAWCCDILKEIATADNLAFKLALIHAEQDKAYLKKRLAEGRIKPLNPAPEFNAAVIDRSERIVGMMGAEPWKRALDAGAEVILAGRSSDTAIFAALPEMRGFPSGMAWHAAKILECGAVRADFRYHVRRCRNLRARKTLGRSEPRGDCIALRAAGG